MVQHSGTFGGLSFFRMAQSSTVLHDPFDLKIGNPSLSLLHKVSVMSLRYKVIGRVLMQVLD